MQWRMFWTFHSELYSRHWTLRTLRAGTARTSPSSPPEIIPETPQEPTRHFPTGCVYKRQLSTSTGGPLPLEVGSNTSTVVPTVAVPGGYKYGPSSWGCLESGTVKLGLGSVNDYASEDQQQLYTTDPSSRQRGRPASTKPQLSD
jgi:hypothetical protein